MDDLANYLIDHPFLRGLDPTKLAELAQCAELLRFEENEPVFRAGEPADRCFLIRKGHVTLEIGEDQRRNIEVQTLGEPSVLGWSWMIPLFRWCFGARAIEPTEVIALDAARLTAICDNDHDFGYELMRRFTAVFAQRLHAARMQLMDIGNKKP